MSGSDWELVRCDRAFKRFSSLYIFCRCYRNTLQVSSLSGCQLDQWRKPRASQYANPILWAHLCLIPTLVLMDKLLSESAFIRAKSSADFIIQGSAECLLVTDLSANIKLWSILCPLKMVLLWRVANKWLLHKWRHKHQALQLLLVSP